MKRLLTILGAYLAACALGAALFASFMIAGSEVFAPSDGPFAFLTAFIIAGAAAIPVALPIVLATEAMRRGEWWIFLGGGLAAAAFLLWMFIPDLETQPTVLALTICPVSALTYWFIAWHRHPPQALGATS